MHNLINTSAGKYIVNVLMIVLFAGLAITGLFFMEGGKRHERGNIQEQLSGEQERFERHKNHGPANFERDEEFEGERGEAGEGIGEIHEIGGILWLILMLLHTIQHWNWYKKLFSVKHVMKNKLLTGTVVVFILLALTSIGLLTEIVPRGLFDLKGIHGFLGQVLVGLVLIHIIQRFKWYITNTKKLFVRKPVAV